MFYQLSSIKKPKRSFNLLHLETSEIYFVSLRASLVVDLKYDEIKGKIHLCSRSLLFEPKDVDQPLIKIKYSNNIIIKLFKNLDSNKLNVLLKTQQNPNNLTEEVIESENQKLQGATDTKNKDPSGELTEKLYVPPFMKQQNSTQNFFKDKLLTCFYIKVDKIFVIYRNPISPYLTEKCTDNLIFSLHKSNTKSQIFRFIKIYDGFQKSYDETQFLTYLIDSTMSEGMKEFKELKKNQNQNIDMLFRCIKVTPEGQIQGLFSIVNKNRLIFYSLVNSVTNQVWEIKLSDVKAFLKYRYLFKHNGLEIWFYNKKRSFLLVFEDKYTRDKVEKQLKENCDKIQNYGLSVSQVTNLWVGGQISNFEYLMYLNTVASRSFNDISQYPIFPWIIYDYQNQELNLNDPSIFRNLSKPIGTINKHRLQKLKQLYSDQLKEKNRDSEPYLYPTHYSSPGLVVYFLIRKIPEFVCKLQNGVFGPTDRIFRSVESTWYATLNLEADFKELIPEFYFSDGDFMVNNDKLELGMTSEGENIDDVVLPNWAKSIHDYMNKNRAALESDYVSANINQWIDLIFGYKNSGEEAVKADNIFYPYTYEKNVQWNKYTSPLEAAAMQIQVQEFGQTPVQLFTSQHPTKKLKIPKNYNTHSDEEIQSMLLQIQHLKGEAERQRRENQEQQQEFQKKEREFNSRSKLTGKTDHKDVNQLLNKKDEQLLQLQMEIKKLNEEKAQLNFQADAFKNELQIYNQGESINSFQQENYGNNPIQPSDFDFLNESENC